MSQPASSSPPSAPPAAALGRLAIVLLLLASAALILLLVAGRSPSLTGRWHDLRYGTRPSAQGFLLTIAPAPAGTIPPGEPGVLVEFTNVSSSPLALPFLEPFGDALLLRGWDEAGQALPQRGSVEGQTVKPLRQTLLQPQGRVGFVVSLDRWLDPPTGRFSLQADWLAPGDTQGVSRCRSNVLWWES